MARVVKFDEIGDAEVLKMVDEPVGEPGPGEVRLDIRAIGLNRSEVMFRQGSTSSNQNSHRASATRRRV